MSDIVLRPEATSRSLKMRLALAVTGLFAAIAGVFMPSAAHAAAPYYSGSAPISNCTVYAELLGPGDGINFPWARTQLRCDSRHDYYISTNLKMTSPAGYTYLLKRTDAGWYTNSPHNYGVLAYDGKACLKGYKYQTVSQIWVQGAGPGGGQGYTYATTGSPKALC